MTTLRNVCIYILMLYCDCQPVFVCPHSAAYGDPAVFKCSNIKNIAFIANSADKLVGSCIAPKCGITRSMKEKMRITFINSTILLTVKAIDTEDEGMWGCQSDRTASCSLTVYKLPTCEINSPKSGNELTKEEDLTLTIILSDYYCTSSIGWNLRIGGKSQKITEFRKREVTKGITNRVVTYSPPATSSLAGPVELTFNCNDETYDVSCSGAEELQLRDPPFCLLTSGNDTDALTIGKNLTLEAAIEKYPCTSGMEYVLLSGSVMVTEFVKIDKFYYATFEVQQEYVGKQLHLKYTCNNVSATTRTKGVTILQTKGEPVKSSASLALAIGLPVGITLLAALLGTLITFLLKRCRSSSTDTPLYDAPSHDTNAEVRYQNLIRNDDTSQRAQELQNIPDVDNKTPQPARETHAVQNVHDDRIQHVSSAEYEYIDNVELPRITEGRTCRDDANQGNNETKSEENINQEYLSAVFERC